MNKSGIIYLCISLAIVIFTAFMVLLPEETVPDDEITLMAINTNTVITETHTTQTVTTLKTTTAKITTSRKVTTTAIITTLSEMETTYSTTTTTTETIPVTTSAESTVTVTTTTTSAPEPVTESVTEQAEEEIFIDINTAGVDELTKLYGIGEVTAYEIVKYREQNGGFNNIEEIMNVYGIGEAKFAGICDYIYVQNPVYPVEEEYDEPAEITESEPETEPEQVTETLPPLTLEDIAPININTAGIDELVLLPHVDEQTAQDIINLREELQKFTHVYELLYVEKLTQKEVAEIVEFVTVGQ